MKPSVIIEEAKKHLWNGISRQDGEQTRFICIAVKSAFGDERYNKTKYKIIKLIKERMSGASTIEGWLHCYHGINPYRTRTKYIQDYRKRWMDVLIKEYEREEK